VSVHPVYGYVNALGFPGHAPVNGAGDSSAGVPLFARAAAGDLHGKTDCFEYTARLPFHPVKFLCFLYQGWPADLRVEGEFWVDNAPDDRCEVLIACARTWYRIAGRWQAAAGPLDGAVQAVALPADWDAVYGYRRQRLVIYGAGTQADAIRRQLDGCLIRDGSEFLRRAARPHDDSTEREMENAI
jgi:G3E family GTPase